MVVVTGLLYFKQAALSRKLNVPSNMDLIAVSEWANKGTMLSEVVSKLT